MKVQDVLNNTKVSVPQGNMNISSRTGSLYAFSDKRYLRFPNVEFGKTYFISWKKRNEIEKKLYAVKFFGICCNNIGIGLVGNMADGNTIIYFGCGSFMVYDKYGCCLGDANEKSKCFCSYVFESVQDFKNEKHIQDERNDLGFCQLLDFCFPQQLKFFKYYFNMYGFNVYPYRWFWDGTQCKKLSIKIPDHFVVLFEKPMNDINFAFNYYGGQIKLPKETEVGIFLTPIEDKLCQFVIEEDIKTYYTIDECENDNKVEVVDFNDETQEKADLVYIEFIGLVSKEKASKILNELQKKI